MLVAEAHVTYGVGPYCSILGPPSSHYCVSRICPLCGFVSNSDFRPRQKKGKHHFVVSENLHQPLLSGTIVRCCCSWPFFTASFLGSTVVYAYRLRLATHSWFKNFSANVITWKIVASVICPFDVVASFVIFGHLGLSYRGHRNHPAFVIVSLRCLPSAVAIDMRYNVGS